MEKISYHDYLADVSVREQIEREARRAQAEAIRTYLLPLLARFCARVSSIRIGLQPPPHANS